MSCSVPFRVRRSAAAARDGYDSSCCSSPSRDSAQQLLLVRRQKFKAKKQPSALQRSLTMSGKKLNKMRSIMGHWKKFTQGRHYSYLDARKNGCLGCPQDDRDSDYSPRSVKRLAVTDGVPEGCLALFVGRERRRFVVGAHYLEHNLFQGLLERSAAESGIDPKAGGITIACEVVLFEHLLWLIGTDDPTSRHLQVDELLDFYAY